MPIPLYCTTVHIAKFRWVFKLSFAFALPSGFKKKKFSSNDIQKQYLQEKKKSSKENQQQVPGCQASLLLVLMPLVNPCFPCKDEICV